ncbi:unnamed protein product [Durusdinium trenchii]|uniref:Uncharacterized protein n=1 Tax=Durusdinium trenchii TaxID=1381693 RepID=A0ABP0RB81_9DINO
MNEDELNAIRKDGPEAAATLLKAAEDGSLEAVLQKKGQARMHQDASISLKIRCPRIVTIPLAIPRRRSGADLRAQDTDALRQEAAATLLKAAKDGTLEAVLSKKGGQDFRTARLVAAVAVGPMHLRRRAGDFNCFEKCDGMVIFSPDDELFGSDPTPTCSPVAHRPPEPFILSNGIRRPRRTAQNMVAHMKMIDFLDEWGFKSDDVNQSGTSDRFPNEKVSPIHVAAQQGDVDVLRLLLAAGADPRTRTSQGRSAQTVAEVADQDGALKLRFDQFLRTMEAKQTWQTLQKDVEGLRQQAAATLLKAAEDGTLQQVLSRRGEEDVEALRQEAAATLLQAAQDGSLEAVLKKKTGPKDLDSLRQEAASTLLRAAEDGTLQAVLSRKTGQAEHGPKKGGEVVWMQDAESLREEAAAILLKAHRACFGHNLTRRTYICLSIV